MKRPVLALAGPTASGKTEVALAIAETHHMEIISVDSRQLYRGMAVGSAAPTAAQRTRVPHHCVDCVEPERVMTAGEFGRWSRGIMDEVRDRGKTPLLVGGSGMYLLAALGGLDEDLPKDPDLRRRLHREAEEQAPESLHERLREVDPESARSILPRDTVRLVRALEIFTLTGTPASRLRTTGGKPTLSAVVAVLQVERDALENNIRRRVAAMIEEGLEDEVRALLARGLSPEQPALKSVGYAETIRYFRGEMTREEWIEAVVVNTRRLAKRQRTWFRSMPETVPVPVHAEMSPGDIAAEVERAFGI